jgi:hypothetical protein
MVMVCRHFPRPVLDGARPKGGAALKEFLRHLGCPF